MLLQALAGVGLLTLDHTHDPATATVVRLHPLIRDTSRHHLHATAEYPTYLATTIDLLDNAA